MAKYRRQNEVDELIKANQPRLNSFIKQRVSNKEDAEDILQDVFYQFVKYLGSAADPIEHVSAWLYRVARNSIINKGIKKKEVAFPTTQNDASEEYILQEFSEFMFSEEQSPSPEVEYLRSLVWVDLEKALSELPAEQREIYELTEMEGIPVKEISELTGVSVNTLLSRKHYAVKYLRQRLSAVYKDIIDLQ